MGKCLMQNYYLHMWVYTYLTIFGDKFVENQKPSFGEVLIFKNSIKNKVK